MWQKGKYGLYESVLNTIIYWPDETGWLVVVSDSEIWTKNGDGWDVDVEENQKVFKGAALVAPLAVLYWSNGE